MTSIALVAVRAAVVLGAALAAMRLMGRTSAATRRSLLVGAFAIVLVLPIGTALLPALHVRGEVSPEIAPIPTATPDSIVEAGAVATTAASARIVQAPHARLAPARSSRISMVAAVVVLWALGAMVVLARLGLGLVRARRLAAAARFVETLDVGGRPVEVRISNTIVSPTVTGLLVPVVLLPRDAQTWTAERRRVVLAHELAHVASHDCLAGAIAQLAVAMHWFDPLVWLAARRLRVERELAADDRVIDEGVLASSYATHLLALATTDAMPAGAIAMAEASEVSIRIRALLAPHRRTPLGRAVCSAWIAATVALAALVACATPEREPPPEQAIESAPAKTPHGSTIDPHVQAIVEQEIDRMHARWAPCAAIVLVLDPHTGQVLAAAHRGGTESTAQLAAARPIVPGSTMKPLVVAAALDEGVIAATDRFDVSPRALDVGEILAVSSNPGLARIFEKLGGVRLALWAKRFHLASAPSTIADTTTGIGIAVGGKLSSTPLEMAAAFATLANDGIYHAPTFVSHRDAGERVVRSETAATVLALLEGVTGERGTGTAARVEGVRVAGKTGTAHLGGDTNLGNDYYASFVGTAPLDNPRYVIFVGAETPHDGGTGGQVAAPVFGRVMSRLLTR